LLPEIIQKGGNMNHQKNLPAETRLNKVKSEFKIWRTTRKNRNPIPADLWEHAVELYPAFTISKISTTLALSYTRNPGTQYLIVAAQLIYKIIFSSGLTFWRKYNGKEFIMTC